MRHIARLGCEQPFPLDVRVFVMAVRIDRPCPNDSVVPYEVVASAAGISPDGPARGTVERDCLAIEMNVPPAWMQRQDGQVAATAWAAQVDRSVLVADPEFAILNRICVRQ